MQGTDRFQRMPEAVQRLPGNAVHQIDVDVVEPGLPRKLKALLKIREGVNAGERGKLVVVDRLQSDAQAVNALSGQAAQ